MMEKLSGEGVGDLLVGFLTGPEADLSEGPSEKAVLLGFLHGERPDGTVLCNKQIRKQSAFYKLSCHPAGHGEFCENKGVVFDFILSEAYNAVFAEVITAGHGKDLAIRKGENIGKFLESILLAGHIQLVGPNHQLIAAERYCFGLGCEKLCP